MAANNRGCERQEELVTYLYNESTPEAVKRFEAHLRECHVCVRELREFSAVRETLQSWELESAPRIVITPKRTWAMAARELFSVTPLWAKGFAAALALLILAALLNVQVSVGRDGFSFRAGWFNSTVAPAPPLQPETPAVTRAETIKLIEQMVIEADRRNQEELRVKLAELSQDLKQNYEVEMDQFVKDLRRDQRRQMQQIWRDVAARNDLTFMGLMNSIEAK